MADSLNDALQELDEMSVVTSGDTLVINNDLRTITVPANFIFGVYNDKNVLSVDFEMPRYYDDIDLSTFSIQINYQAASGVGNIYEITTPVVGTDKITFEWLLDRGVFLKAGDVTFIVCLREILSGSEGTVLREFNTTVAKGKVLEGLEVEDPEDPEAYSIIAHLKSIDQRVTAQASDVANKFVAVSSMASEATSKYNEAIAAIDGAKEFYGSPLVAATAAGMTDRTKVYVYTGNETGYTFGNWYYYDGSAWTSGGVYNSAAVNTDETLSVSGMAADSKKVGDEISDLKEDLTEAVNYNLDILIECLRNIVWLNPSAEDLIDQFKYVEDTPEVVSLSAYITSLDSSIVVDGDLDSLRPYLSVKATYDDETSAQVTGYTLSGSLVTGINTITVSYGGKNTQVYLYLPIGNPDHILYELPQNTRTNYTRINSGIQLDATDSDYTVLGIVEDISVFGESTSQHRIVDGSMNPSGISYAKGTNVYVNPSNGNKKYVIMCDAKAITSSEYSDQSHTLKFVARRTFSGANATITVSLFVDGTKIQTRNESRNTAYNGTTHSKPIGVGGTLAISDGSIYNITDAIFSLFRIYDRALTDSEINTILGVTI